MLVSSVGQNDSVTCLCILFQILLYYSLLQEIEYIVPYAPQQILVVYLFYIECCVSVNPILLRLLALISGSPALV